MFFRDVFEFVAYVELLLNKLTIDKLSLAVWGGQIIPQTQK